MIYQTLLIEFSFLNSQHTGYYLTFLSGGLFTQAGRSLRRHFRPLFLGNKYSKFIYDCITFIATKVSMAYLAFPFVLLEFSTSLKIYYRLYFIGHLACLFAIFVLPSLIRIFKRPVRKEEKDLSKKD